MHEMWDTMKKRYVRAAQDLAYAAERYRALAQQSTASECEKFAGWLNMVAEDHRRGCESMGVDTRRPPREFPLSEYEVHHMLLTDPYVAAAAKLLDHIDRRCYTPDNGYRAALIVTALYEAGIITNTPFARHEAVLEAMFNTYRIHFYDDKV